MSKRFARSGRIGVLTLAALCALTSAEAHAQGTQSPTADAGPRATRAPRLKTHVQAVYPEAARRDGREGTVGLELTVDESGKVVDARVTSSAGSDLDRAALDAAMQFVFEPAEQDGKPIAAKVQFAYELKLPPDARPSGGSASPAPSPAPIPSPPPPPAPSASASASTGTGTRDVEETQTGADQTTLVLARRPTSAASSSSVRDRDFRLRPIGSTADILRVTPGLLVVQHAGGGKANQYFLRGFDADHGTDIAFSIDGVPINMPSHGHGQGYTDTSFVIPELVQRVEITKGPYFAEQGDFATAGSINLVTQREMEHSSIGFGTGGSPGHGGPMYRGLVIAAPRLGSVRPLFAAELGRSEGPFLRGEDFNRYKLFNKVTWDVSDRSTLTLAHAGYAGDWYGSGQIPLREVDGGRLDRFGTLDPTEGGDSARHQIMAAYKLRPSDRSELSAMAYAAQYRFDLYSNFTLFLNDADRGDQIHQIDRRTFFGGRASYRVVHDAGSVRFDTTAGGELRNDIIKNALFHSQERKNLDAITDHRVQQTSIGVFGREEVTLAPWLRAVGGARADFFSFAVDDALEQPGGPETATSGVRGASQLSPKASLVASALRDRDASLDLFANWGHGFHSNDARGVVRRTDPVTPLTRAVGSEIGARARLFERLDLAAALWQLDLRSETVWVGDEGTTEAGGATNRWGGEFEARYEITPWLAADLDLTASKSQFVQNAGNGTSVALAPRFTWAGGLSARHPTGLRGGVRFYGVGDRPATEDEFLTAKGFTVFDLHAGYRHRRFDVGVDVENLFDERYRSAQFATTSRLRTDPPTDAPAPPAACGGSSRAVTSPSGTFAGCEDIHFTPGYPLTVRVMTTVFLD
jgi:TonB family protein